MSGGVGVRYAVIAALMLALAACGPRPQSGAGADGADGSAGGTASGCPGAEGPLAEFACQNAEMSEAAGDLLASAREARQRLSADGARIALENERRWIAAQRVLCKADAGGALNAEAVQCLKAAIAERAAKAKAEVQTLGGLTFQTVELVDALPVNQAEAAEIGLSEVAPEAVLQAARFPRIDNPKRSAVIEKVNAALAQRLTGVSGPLPSEEQIDYQLAFAGEKLVSVRFDSYEFALGAAHPNSSARGVTLRMDTGEPIAPADVFKPSSGWETYLTRRAVRELTAAFEEMGAVAPESADVRDTATKTHNWVIDEAGITLLFPPYSVGPYALGGHEVKIPWADLKPYIAPDAPAPIRAG